MIELQSVISSNVKEVGYDHKRGALIMVFLSDPDTAYVYKGISESVYDSIATAGSVGGTFHKLIKARGTSFVTEDYSTLQSLVQSEKDE